MIQHWHLPEWIVTSQCKVFINSIKANYSTWKENVQNILIYIYLPIFVCESVILLAIVYNVQHCVSYVHEWDKSTLQTSKYAIPKTMRFIVQKQHWTFVIGFLGRSFIFVNKICHDLIIQTNSFLSTNIAPLNPKHTFNDSLIVGVDWWDILHVNSYQVSS